MDLVTQIITDPDLLIAIAGVVVGVFGCILTIRFFRESNPVYVLSTNTLDGIRHPKLKIEFDGEKVSSLHSIRFVLLNKGRKEIRHEDIPGPGAEPRIEVPANCKILDSSVFSTNGDRSAGVVVNEKRSAVFTFDFLNHNDALVAEFICSSAANTTFHPRVNGRLKGMDLIQGEASRYGSFGEKVYILIVTPFFAFGAIHLVYKIYIGTISGEKLLPIIGNIGMLVFFLVLLLGAIFHISSFGRKVPKIFEDFLFNRIKIESLKSTE